MSKSKINVKSFKDILIDSVIISSAIIVSTFTAIYQLYLVNINEDLNYEIPIMLSIIDIIVILATNVLAIVWKRKTVAAFNTIIYFLSSSAYSVYLISGKTDVFASTPLNQLLMLFFFPAQSFAALGSNNTVPLIVTFAMLLSSLASIIIIKVIENGKNKA